MLYLIPEWELKLRDAIRVLRRDGVILHEWGNRSPVEAEGIRAHSIQVHARKRRWIVLCGVEGHPAARRSGASATLASRERLPRL